jgi:pilus assembly protein CpaB
MKVARLAVIGVALASGLGAALLLGGGGEPPPPAEAPAAEIRGAPTTEVLVATAAVPIGARLSPGNMDWRRWPDEALAPYFIRRPAQPQAREELDRAIARFPLSAGEPINPQRVIRADRPGFMAAILAAGMRAVSVPVAADTGAGGFILPNDRVDVILTRRTDASSDSVTSTTVLSNVKVLAIDQTAQEGDGDRTVVGRVATLELDAQQAEILSASRRLGDLTLALRSLADANIRGEAEGDQRRGSMTIIRYGVPSQVPLVGR